MRTLAVFTVVIFLAVLPQTLQQNPGNKGKGNGKENKPQNKEPAKGSINNGNSPSKIEGQYIIILKNDTKITGRLRAALGPNPQIVRNITFPEGLVGFTARIKNPNALENILKKVEEVEYVEADSLLTETAPPPGRGNPHRQSSTTPVPDTQTPAPTPPPEAPTPPPTEGTPPLTDPPAVPVDGAPSLPPTPAPAPVEQTTTTPSVTPSTEDPDKEPCFGQRSAPDNLVRISSRLPHSDDETFRYEGGGMNTAIYVLDTGVSLQHQEFGGRARFLTSYAATSQPEADLDGHGTHVASTAAGASYGVAKNAIIYSVKILGDDGSGSVSDIISGLGHVLEHHKQRGKGAKSVVNMSVGGPGYSPTMDRTIEILYNAGVQVVVAAGNEFTDACQTIPSHSFHSISVGCTKNNDEMCSFSNYGPCVDVFAPGYNIRAARANSNSDTVTMSGTSMSSPHVAGAVANFLSSAGDHTPSSDDVVSWLLDTATTDRLYLGGALPSPNRLLFASCGGAGYNTDYRSNPKPDDPVSAAKTLSSSAVVAVLFSIITMLFLQ